MVDSSECLLAIFSQSVPPIASQEIVRVFERRRDGAPVDFQLFLGRIVAVGVPTAGDVAAAPRGGG
jgi:hypothetical protein